MPSSKKMKKEEFVMRDVPPGYMNKDKYFLILGNLPFVKDWRNLKKWLEAELRKRAPPGKENMYTVEYTSTLKLGTGWARVRGLDVFDAAVYVATNVPYQGRNLMVYDKNRTEYVQIMDCPRQDGRWNQSKRAPVPHQPTWTFDPESTWEKYASQYEQPGLGAAKDEYSQQQTPISPSAYYPPSGAYGAEMGQPAFALPAAGHSPAASPTATCMEWGYAPAAQQYYGQMPVAASAYPTQSYEAYRTATTQQPPGQVGAGTYTPASAPAPTVPQQEGYVVTEQRQVMIRNIPIKISAASASATASISTAQPTSSSSRRKGGHHSHNHHRNAGGGGGWKDRLRTQEEVRQYLTAAVVGTNFYTAADIERVVAEHRAGDPPTLRGYAVLHMKTAKAAQHMVSVLNGTVWDGRTLRAELGKDASTVSPSQPVIAVGTSASIGAGASAEAGAAAETAAAAAQGGGGGGRKKR